MFTSTPAKHAYLAAMTHIHLGHADDAIRETSTAIGLWTTGPPEECAGSALAVARIDLVTAHLIRSELDAAEHTARLLLAVAPEQRTTIVLKRLNIHEIWHNAGDPHPDRYRLTINPQGHAILLDDRQSPHSWKL